jgi:hypothetical protein
MPAVNPDKLVVPVKDRLSTRLGLIFTGTFLLVTILLIAATMFGAIGDQRIADSDAGAAAPVIVIDPKIRADLAKAISFDALPPTTEVQNPFIDRAGIGTSLVASPPAAASQTAGAAQPGTATAGTAMRRFDGGQNGIAQSGSSPDFGIDASSLKARHHEWLDRQRRGEFAGEESEVLAVEDLVPVGYASGGDRADEVMLFSLTLCRTFSFPIGTRFLNGTLNGFDQREVIFTFQSGIRRKSYSTVETCGNSGPGTTSAGN